MFFPKGVVHAEKLFVADSDVYLEAGHICVKKNVAEKIFGSHGAILSVYYEAEKTFLAAPLNEEVFKIIHKAKQQMLKDKNAAGDKSISVQEILLDHELNNNDRNLEYTAEEALHTLKVKL